MGAWTERKLKWKWSKSNWRSEGLDLNLNLKVRPFITLWIKIKAWSNGTSQDSKFQTLRLNKILVAIFKQFKFHCISNVRVLEAHGLWLDLKISHKAHKSLWSTKSRWNCDFELGESSDFIFRYYFWPRNLKTIIVSNNLNDSVVEVWFCYKVSSYDDLLHDISNLPLIFYSGISLLVVRNLHLNILASRSSPHNE